MAILKLRLGEGEKILDGLLRQGVELAHECGGTLACATCRVIVREGLEKLAPASDDERDMLDRAASLESGARLACQASGDGGELVIEVPQDEAARIGTPLQGAARPIVLTAAAAQHFAAQLAKRTGAVAVRLSVRAAGCSGYRYRVDHAHALDADDVVFQSHGIRIAVDPISLPQVQGMTVDVVRDGLSRRVRFDNPNAVQTCGCGESFRM